MKHIALTLSCLVLLPLGSAACGSDTTLRCALNDADCDGVPDDLGRAVNLDGKPGPDPLDIDGDGIADGYAIDRNDDGQPDALGIDTTGDGLVDSVDINLDFVIDEQTPNGTYGQQSTVGSGGASASAGGSSAASGGSVAATGGADASTGGSLVVDQGGGCLEDGATQSGSGNANGNNDAARYAKGDVQRGNDWFRIIANGWGDNWTNHNITWLGTNMDVVSFNGDIGPNYAPAGYPTVYVGNYSNTGTSFSSPLPKALSALSSLNTGVRWSHPAAAGEYNVAYDVWLSNDGSNLSGYFMVWLRDPPNQRPAGDKREQGVTVEGVPGVWDIWAGSVNGKPIINYVRPEGQDTHELAFDMLTFMDDAKSHNYTLPGSQVLSVAIGFEIWQGPISNLSIDDFCVKVN